MLAHGQNLEDVLLWRALKHINNGFYVDVGAQHPTVDSVSKYFYSQGWRGINIEPSPYYAEMLRNERPEDITIEAVASDNDTSIEFYEIAETGMSTGSPARAKALVEQGLAHIRREVASVRLDHVFDTMCPPEIHWLKIDAEEMEDKVLGGWRQSLKRPWIIVIEVRSSADTLHSWIRELGAYGYSEVFFDGVNSYFLSDAHADLADAFRAPPNATDEFLLAPTHSWCGPAMHHLHNEKLLTAQYLAEISHLTETLLEVRHENSEWAEKHNRLQEKLSSQIAVYNETVIKKEKFEEEILILKGYISNIYNNYSTRIKLLFLNTTGFRKLFPYFFSETISQYLTFSSNAPTAEASSSERPKCNRRGQLGKISDLRQLLSLDGYAFIEGAYRTLLGREPDDGGIATYLRLMSRGWSKKSILYNLRQAAKDQGREEPFVGLDDQLMLYRRYERPFERVIVSLGIAAALKRKKFRNLAGLPVRLVDDIPPPQRLHTVDELFQLNGTAFLNAAYLAILGRVPDPEGRAFYLNRLRGGGGREEVAVQLYQSREGRAFATKLAGLESLAKRMSRRQAYRWAIPNSNSRRDLRILGAELSRIEDRLASKLAELDRRITAIPAHQERPASLDDHFRSKRLVNQERRLPLKPSADNSKDAAARVAFLYVDHTSKCDLNTGMQRVVRKLARALIEEHETVVLVKWDADLKKLVLINQTELAHLAKWNGPILPPDACDWYPEEGSAEIILPDVPTDSWLIVPEVTHITYHEKDVTLDLIMAARAMNMRVGFIYYDAIPLRMPEYKAAAEAHDGYMQALLLTDIVFPISHRSAAELEQYFEQHQMAQRLPLIEALPLPGESSLTARILAPREGKYEKVILSVGSIEPRKNQLRLVEAFEKFAGTPAGADWTLLLAGHLRGDVAESVHAAMRRLDRIQYISHPSDDKLDELYRGAAFTVFPSVEEGFGLPILESLWYGVPCVCANFGAMMEVAEGGGCLTIDTRDVGELGTALHRLATDPELRTKLSNEAVSRSMENWMDYTRSMLSAVTAVSNEPPLLKPIYYWVNDTQHNPHNSGIQRVVRQLAKAMLARGQALIPCGWDGDKLNPVNAEGLAHLAKWNGPAASEWSEWIPPTDGTTEGWLLIPELAHGAMRAAHGYAHAAGLRAAAIFYDTIPYKMADEFGPTFAANHAEYMRALSDYDKVFPISRYSHEELMAFFLGEPIQTHSFEERFNAVAKLGPMTERPRETRPFTAIEGPVQIISVISVEPRKNPLRLLEAFQQASRTSRRPLHLTIVGREIPAFADLAENVREYVRQLDNLEWKQDIDDEQLAALYGSASFTVFPSLEEGYGLPIVESLWNGRPCIVHDDGAMAEIATGGGCLNVDMRDVNAISMAIAKLANDDACLHALGEQARRRPLPSWDDYADTILTDLRNDRLTDALPIRQRKAWTQPIRDELPNLSSRPKLSLCISTYNRGPWLAVNLRNLFTLHPVPLKDVEILVVDNTSTDNTEEVVQPYLDRADFRFIRNPKNVGMLGNLTVTAHAARGEYIWILGDDDLIKTGCIERILRVIKEHPGVALIYPNYAYTNEVDPNAVGQDIQAFLDTCPILTPSGPDQWGFVRDVADNNENLFTAIYCLIFRRDHALRAYSQDTSGRPFSTMRTSIPTTYYCLNFMMDEPAYWIGEISMVVNFNVSWNKYASLQILERVPEAQDLAQRLGASGPGMDRWRVNLMQGIAHFWQQMFENDGEQNADFFKPERVVMRMKHLPEFREIVPGLIEVYNRARANGHPAAVLDSQVLFKAFI